MTQLNITAIKAMAIVTAYYQREHSPSMGINDVYDDFDAIRLQAAENLKWAGIEDTVSDFEVAESIWHMDADDYLEFMMDRDELEEQE